MPLAAGRLIHRVTIETNRPTARNSVGQPIPDWSGPGEARWARVEDLSGRMLMAAQAAGSRARTMVTLRAPVTLRPLEHRIRFEARGEVRYLNPEEVRRDPDGEYVEVMCAEIVVGAGAGG